MQQVRPLSVPPSAQVVLDYRSPHGPTVTHMRGVMLVNSLANLQQWGVYERYLELLPEPARSTLTAVIAASWVEAEYAVRHYEVADRLGISDGDAQAAGEALAERIAETYLGSLRRAAERAGVEPFTYVMSNNHRTWERMFQGGGCTLTQHGPKDLVLEDHGNPLVGFRMYRVGYLAYMKAQAAMFCQAAFVKQEPPRPSEPHRLVTRFTWL